VEAQVKEKEGDSNQLKDLALHLSPQERLLKGILKASLTLNSFLPSALFAQSDVMQQSVVKAVDHCHQLIERTSSSVIMRSVEVDT